jgi:hypothetical protein
VGWIDVAQDKDYWQILMNTVMHFMCHNTLGISQTAEQLLALQEDCCSVQLSVDCNIFNRTHRALQSAAWAAVQDKNQVKILTPN